MRRNLKMTDDDARDARFMVAAGHHPDDVAPLFGVTHEAHAARRAATPPPRVGNPYAAAELAAATDEARRLLDTQEAA